MSVQAGFDVIVPVAAGLDTRAGAGDWVKTFVRDSSGLGPTTGC